MFVVVLMLLFAALWIEALWRLALAALICAPVLFCEVAAMHWAASLHLADPSASLNAFLGAGVVARLALECTLGALRRRMA